jgi:hypothetical protein
MSVFNAFAIAVNQNYASMLAADPQNTNMFLMDVAGDVLWAEYIASFPEGTNPMFRNKTEHECSTCRSFVKNLGAVVTLKDGEILTVWDTISTGTYLDTVALRMSIFIAGLTIKSKFLVNENQYGVVRTHTTLADGAIETWNHFCGKVDKPHNLKLQGGAVIGDSTADKEVLERSLKEIDQATIDLVLELIDTNAIYRGAEFKGIVTALQKTQREYAAATDKSLFLWATAGRLKGAGRFRNTVIGTLLSDLADGVELNKAVASFEAKVAPTNYKRPTALVTQKMLDNAAAVVEELGIEASLYRRFATQTDVNVSDVLFADNVVRPTMLGGLFEGVKPTAKKSKKLDNIDTMSVEDFIKKVLPVSQSVEVYVESKHASNFVSVIAPEHADAAPLFKWDNAFSWSYVGEVTDSIKERVKNAGGSVTGDIRVSLSWHNSDDLDLSFMKTAYDGISFSNKWSLGGELDLDMNAFGKKDDVAPVENITWKNVNDLPKGTYAIVVNQYNQRSSANVGFEVEVEILGKIFTFEQTEMARGRKTIGKLVKTAEGISLEGFTEGKCSREVWGITTEQWVPVDMVMKSPNHWEGSAIGNEHLFFILKGCVNPDSARGFYNEFLRQDLDAHRKVFELLASKTKAAYTEHQLSGIGISTTKKEEILVRVTGSVTRTIKVAF